MKWFLFLSEKIPASFISFEIKFYLRFTFINKLYWIPTMTYWTWQSNNWSSFYSITMALTRRRSDSKCGDIGESFHRKNQNKTKFITLKGLRKPLRIADVIERILRSYFLLSLPLVLGVTTPVADLSRLKWNYFFRKFT